MYKIGQMPKSIELGYIGENLFRTIEIDMSAWVEKLPGGVPSIIHIQPGKTEADAYIADTSFDTETNVLSWTVTDEDLGTMDSDNNGEGEIQIWMQEETDDDSVTKCGKSIHIASIIHKSATEPDDTPPAAQTGWMEAMTALKTATVNAAEDAADAKDDAVAAKEAAEDAQEAAEAATVHQPTVGQNGNWYVWNQLAGEYQDTQIPASGDPTILIDDTSTGLDKSWSAQKSNTLLNAFQEQKSEDRDNFHNIIDIMEGDNLLNVSIIEGKYAKYSAKTLGTLSSTNVAVFNVTNVVKFEYRYTIDEPDARGLYFVDKNGTALETSYQTLSTKRDITVPDGAVQCYATIREFTNDIFVYEVVGEKPVELLKDQATYTSRTHGGITYDWQQNNTKVYIHGKRSSTSIDTMYNNENALPSGMVNGGRYRFVINAQSSAIQLVLLPYINGSEGQIVSFSGEGMYTIPATWTGLAIRIMVFGTNVEVDETIKCPEIYTVPTVKSLADQVNDLKDAAYGNATNPLAYVRRDAGLLSIFHTVGCIGDSLASGECAYKESGTTHYTDLYPFSWGQCLARLTGNTYYNFSQGGLSSRTWLTSQHCTDCFDGNHDCDAYFIGLGQNDKNNSIPVGTTADINLSDYTQNADTYCGNMGQIIQRLQILQPKAPIFVFIDPNTPMGDQAYNNVIPDIVELFDNVWIIDLKTYGEALFTDKTNIIGSQYRGGHYSAVGYQEIAHVIATYTDWIIRHNLSDFSQVEFIGTNYEWTT